MKFAKELEQELVPEWQAKYLDYKSAKKKLKAVERAIRNVNQTPRSIRRRGPNRFMPTPSASAPAYSFLNRPHGYRGGEVADEHIRDSRSAAFSSNNDWAAERGTNGDGTASDNSSPASNAPDTTPLFQQNGGYSAQSVRGNGGMTRYGSIIGSPPNMASTERVPTLNLPEPAMEPESPQETQRGMTHSLSRFSKGIHRKANHGLDGTASAFEVGKTRHPSKSPATLAPRHRSIFQPKRVNSMPHIEGPRPLLKRLLSVGGGHGPPTSLGDTDVPLEAYREVDFRQAEFFMFLDKELEKIEDFYKQKESEASKRLEVLRQQLHIMRDRRLEEVINRETAKMRHDQAADEELLGAANGDPSHSRSEVKQVSWLHPLDGALLAAKEAVKTGRFGKSTKAMTELATPSAMSPKDQDAARDYTRRPVSPSVPYRVAKRRLKAALMEYYRGLELLKSYALLNRTAFRKINKKYDKTVNARPSGRYMAEKVNKAWFVKSDVLDGHMRMIEDLYARYFEQGNHKVAAGKLRSKVARPGDYTANAFRNGLLLAAGLVFGIEGLVRGANMLFSHDPVLKERTSYLLQIYGGYTLMLLLMLMYCFDCKIWSEERINYPFIFEFDTRHHLDWRQLSELPCLFVLLLGLTMWLNFRQIGGDVMYPYYPAILVGLSVLILFLPLPFLYQRTRGWFLYSHWRLFFAGLYPVEFRDFFLGDMFCSLTYSFGNLELFFCLYAHNWNNPPQCNSSHSRLLGFFTALPPIWRLLQCLRRYYDTRDIFPHLVNGGKYAFNILTAMSLSLWRIQLVEGGALHLMALFIVFATINGIYTSIWDVFMDFSLGDPSAPHPFLRENLSLKYTWFYYLMMVLDPILRFSWIFYPIYISDIQHSALMTFGVALAEVCRRGLWSILRVENEHCTNVGRFRASRDIALPYEIPSGDRDAQEEEQDHIDFHDVSYFPPTHLTPRSTWPQPMGSAQQATGADLERARSGESSLRLRQRSATERVVAPSGGFSRVGDIMRTAHAMDFERKRRPAISVAKESDRDGEGGSSDDEDGEEGRAAGGNTDGAADERDADEVINAEALLERALNRETNY